MPTLLASASGIGVPVGMTFGGVSSSFCSRQRGHNMVLNDGGLSPEEVIGLIRASRAEIDAILNGISDHQMIEPRDSGGWSIKDHLAHIAEWQRHALAVLSGIPAHEARGLEREAHDRLETDDLNEILYQRNVCRPLSDVLWDFRQTHEEAIRAISQMSATELQRQLSPDIAVEPVRVIEVVIGTFARHNDHHLADIRALADS